MTSITFELDEAAVIIDALATPARRGKMREQTAVRSLTEVSACMRAGFPEMQVFSCRGIISRFIH